MFKRPLCEMASGLILGILFMKYKKWYLAAAAAGILFCIAQNLWRNVICSEKEKNCAATTVTEWKSGFWKENVRKWMYLSARVGCFLAFFLAGMFHYAENEAFRQNYMTKLCDGMGVTVQGKLGSKQAKNGQYSYYLDQCYLSIGQEILPCNQILFYQNSDAYSIGQTLIVTGTVELWKGASNDGNFDAKSFYESKKIDFKLNDAAVQEAYGAKDSFGEKVYRLRRKLAGVYEACMKEQDAGVLSTMTLGEKNLLDADVKQMYQKAGISHVLAISGLHISVIGMGLYRLLRKVRYSFFGAGVIAESVIVCYGIMSGFGTSTVRAVLMFLVLLCGQWIGRSYDSLSALGFAAIVILWDNPYLLWYAGFLLSFAAVLGIAVAGQTLLKIQKPFFQFTENFLVSFAIQLSTVPLTAYFFYEVPVWSMFINFFILPVIGILLFLGLTGGFLGLVSFPAAKTVLVPCHWILAFYEKVCRLSTRLPGATWITGKPDWKKLVFYYATVCVILFVMKQLKRRTGFVFTGSILLLLVLYNPVKGFELDVLDVGQGDGIYLHTKDGTNLFFDGGSTDVSKVGTYRMLPFLKSKGVGKIDYWIVSHTDADHISGLKEVLEAGYEIDHIVVSAYILEDEAYQSLTDTAETYGTEILDMDYGEVLTDGEAELRCIFPDKTYKSEDKNARSLVLLYEENGFSGIFTGDISSAEEAYLIKQGRIKDVDFYKAAHHGSKYSNSLEFLLELSPEITTISCGENNRYGHPGEEALAHIRQSKSAVYETMESGRIRIRVEKGRLVVDEFR